MEPKLTFAIPFYRGLVYLREAIESVLAQSRPEWRLLVSDDGGEEPGAEELVASFRDPRIAYHRNPRNLGMVPNWNLCIERADTDLVTLLHADDRVLPDYAAIVLELAGRHPKAACFFCGASIVDAQGRPRFSLADAVKRLFVPRGSGDLVLRGEPSLRTLMAGNFIMCPTLCLRRSVIGSRRFSERWRQVQDLDFTSRLLMEGEVLVGSRQVGYAYRRHPGNATALQSESLLRFEEEFALFEGVGAKARELGWEAAARVAKRASIVKLHLLYRTLRDLTALRTDEAVAKLRLLRHRREPARPDPS